MFTFSQGYNSSQFCYLIVKIFNQKLCIPLLLGDSSDIEKSQFYILWGPPKMV